MARLRASVTDTRGQTVSVVQNVTVLARDPFLWPFASDNVVVHGVNCPSIFNRPIGSGAVYVPTVSPVFRPSPNMLVGINVSNYGKSFFLAAPTDPFVPLYQSNTPSPGVHTFVMFAQSPAVATPQTGTDGHMGLVDAAKTRVYESSTVRAHTGTHGRGWRGEKWYDNDLRGPGFTVNSAGVHIFHGSGAWGNVAIGGLIRAGEPEHGIRHALAVTINNAALNGGFDGQQWPPARPAQGPGFVWPAISKDNNYGTSGNLHLGCLLAIPYSVDVEALGITDPRARNFARCFQRYGLYATGVGAVYDGFVMNGNGAEAAQLSFPNRGIPGPTGNDHPFWVGVRLAASRLQLVQNATTPATCGGGGTPRQPLAPPFEM